MNSNYFSFNRWERKQDDSVLHISHQSTYEAFWEPFYVSIDKETPPHDERFVGYGFTRNGQVMEMAIAGWKFYVLSPAFTIHWGFHFAGYQSEHRVKETEKNRIRFKEYLAEKIEYYSKKKDNGLTPKLRAQLNKAMARTKKLIFYDERVARQREARRQYALKHLGTNRRTHPRWTKVRWNNFISKRREALQKTTKKPQEYKLDKLSHQVNDVIYKS